jgi:hypothetical protein
MAGQAPTQPGWQARLDGAEKSQDLSYLGRIPAQRCWILDCFSSLRIASELAERRRCRWPGGFLAKKDDDHLALPEVLHEGLADRERMQSRVEAWQRRGEVGRKNSCWNQTEKY